MAPRGAPFPSPSRTRVSMVFSRSPLTPFKTMALRLSSVKPISRSCVSFRAMASVPSSTVPPTVAPKTFEGLFRSSLGCSSNWWEELFLDRNDKGNVELVFLKKPPVFGGGGGGTPSSDSALRRDRPFPFALAVFVTYFALMNRSMAESASSASTGTGGCLLSGLYILFEALLPTFFILCSKSQECSRRREERLGCVPRPARSSSRPC